MISSLTGVHFLITYGCSAECDHCFIWGSRKEGRGSMFCLAGLGAGIQSMVQTAKDADLNVVLEGCPMDCAKKIFDNLGLKNYVQIRATDLGIEKKKGVPVKDEEIAKVVAKAKEALAKA